jgi:hypothetical protein
VGPHAGQRLNEIVARSGQPISERERAEAGYGLMTVAEFVETCIGAPEEEGGAHGPSRPVLSQLFNSSTKQSRIASRPRRRNSAGARVTVWPTCQLWRPRPIFRRDAISRPVLIVLGHSYCSR